MKRYL